MALLDDLEAEVRADTDVKSAAGKLIRGLAAALQAAKDANDPARLQAVIDAMKNNTAGLVVDITAGTPAA